MRTLQEHGDRLGRLDRSPAPPSGGRRPPARGARAGCVAGGWAGARPIARDRGAARRGDGGRGVRAGAGAGGAGAAAVVAAYRGRRARRWPAPRRRPRRTGPAARFAAAGGGGRRGRAAARGGGGGGLCRPRHRPRRELGPCTGARPDGDAPADAGRRRIGRDRDEPARRGRDGAQRGHDALGRARRRLHRARGECAGAARVRGRAAAAARRTGRRHLARGVE